MKTKEKKPAAPTGKLVSVNYDKALEAFLSRSETEVSIERAVAQLNQRAENARRCYRAMFKKAGLDPDRTYRWDSDQKAVFDMTEAQVEPPT